MSSFWGQAPKSRRNFTNRCEVSQKIEPPYYSRWETCEWHSGRRRLENLCVWLLFRVNITRARASCRTVWRKLHYLYTTPLSSAAARWELHCLMQTGIQVNPAVIARYSHLTTCSTWKQVDAAAQARAVLDAVKPSPLALLSSGRR